MKKMRKMAGVLTAVSLLAASLTPAMVQADSQKVVTLGADLTDSQKSVMLKYFGVSAESVQIIEVTNQEERDTLGSYIPLEQIGTRTLSCAYVQPTTSGGIQVKTANLNFVTSNMIAAALSTSGVKNCNVIAACPIEVSGTGALTGVTKAFEAATNTTLDESKKQTAAKEIVTTGQVAESVGQQQATEIVNDIKIQIIENKVSDTDTDQIAEIVDDAVSDASKTDSTDSSVSDSTVTVRLSDEDRQALEDLAKQIAAENYNYDDVKETLDRVEKNTSGDTNVNVNVNVDNSNTNTNSAVNENTNSTVNENTNTASTTDSLSSDNILVNTDDSALGDNVIEDATTQQALTGTDSGAQNSAASSTASENQALFSITTQDQYQDSTAQPTDHASQSTAQSTNETDQASQSTTSQNPDAAASSDVTATSSTSSETLTPAVAFVTSDLEQPLLNSFALRFYVEGSLVPSSGTITLKDESGNEVKTFDLSDSSQWGSVDVTDDEKLNGLGWNEATEIYVLTGNILLSDGTYSVTGNVVFAEKGEDGTPKVGTETAPVVIDQPQASYASSDLSIQADSDQGFKAGSTASLYVSMPDGAARAEIASNHEEVASLSEPAIEASDESGAEVTESTPVTVSLLAEGDTELDATFYDADGNILTTQSLSIAVF